MATVSVIILANGIDAQLKQAIASGNWADEVVVIATKEAAWDKLPGSVRVVRYFIPHGSITDFSQLRNWAVEQASSEWVLFLDSDEVLPPTAITVLKPLLERSDLDGVYLYRQDVFLGKALRWGEAGALPLLRLSRKSKTHFSGKVHEIAEVEGNLTSVPVTITHYAHEDIQSFITKISYYSLLVAKERHEAGQRFQLWQLLFLPIGKFLWNYVGKLGLLDGWRGLIYAVLMSIHSASVRIYLYELSQQHKRT